MLILLYFISPVKIFRCVPYYKAQPYNMEHTLCVCVIIHHSKWQLLQKKIIIHTKLWSSSEIIQIPDLLIHFTLYNTSIFMLIKRARKARTFNRRGWFGRCTTESSPAKNERSLQQLTIPRPFQFSLTFCIYSQLFPDFLHSLSIY